uniref:Putative reeler domain protein n=1 Tax=Nyssomyia neivai TaxID=330878 RepID=A0A1L8E3Q0_9DIPT
MLKVFLIFVLCFVQIFAHFINKPPKFSCDVKTDIPPQPQEKMPYKFTVSGYKYSPETNVTITISGQPFHLFHVRAFDEVTNLPIGSWKETPSVRTISICNAAAATDEEEKESVELTWIPPPAQSGRVLFKASVMWNHGMYWVTLLMDQENLDDIEFAKIAKKLQQPHEFLN